MDLEAADCLYKDKNFHIILKSKISFVSSSNQITITINNNPKHSGDDFFRFKHFSDWVFCINFFLIFVERRICLGINHITSRLNEKKKYFSF